MNHELLAILEYIEQERGVSKDQLIDAVEKALLTASRKSIHPANELGRPCRTISIYHTFRNFSIPESAFHGIFPFCFNETKANEEVPHSPLVQIKLKPGEIIRA